MIRLLIKLLVFAILAALVYGLWSMYQEKTPEQRQELRGRVVGIFRDAGRIFGAALLKTVEKGRSLVQDREKTRDKTR
ncbi:MAG: hypothetical protein NTV79_08625 [Candidatus Aureabacteria bacterium]|nr:hypothetical protein [Candidatus Auribacterota bacterium]